MMPGEASGKASRIASISTSAVIFCSFQQVYGGHSGRHQKIVTDPCRSQVSVAVSLVVQKGKQGSDGRFVSSDHAHSVSVLESVAIDRALEGLKRKCLLLGLEPGKQAVLDGHQAGVLDCAGADGRVWPVTGWPAAMRWCCFTSAPVIGTVPWVGLSLMVGSFEN
jgi:hypothetical protein